MIEILVVRDPDSDNQIEVWLDGDKLAWAEYTLIEVDAGRGYDYADWLDNVRHVLADPVMSTGFHAAVEAAYADPPGKKYIDGWPEEDL